MKWLFIIFTTLYILGSYSLVILYMPFEYWVFYTIVYILGCTSVFWT